MTRLNLGILLRFSCHKKDAGGWGGGGEPTPKHEKVHLPMEDLKYTSTHITAMPTKITRSHNLFTNDDDDVITRKKGKPIMEPMTLFKVFLETL